MSAPVTLRRYDLPSINGEGWGTIVLGSDGFFAAVTDYGNYAFQWTHHGMPDFRLFWAHRDYTYPSYILSKLLQGGEVYDPEETLRGIKKDIRERRRLQDISKDEAREEWDRLDEYEGVATEYDFNRWVETSNLDEAWDFRCEMWPAGPLAFVTKLLPRWAEALRAELAAEQAATGVKPRGCARMCMDCVQCLSPLPEGKVCNDCAHVSRCKSMFGTEGPETECQFIPSRWREGSVELARGAA